MWLIVVGIAFIVFCIIFARHKGEKTNNRRKDQIFFDMTAAQESNFRNNVAKDE